MCDHRKIKGSKTSQREGDPPFFDQDPLVQVNSFVSHAICLGVACPLEMEHLNIVQEGKKS